MTFYKEAEGIDADIESIENLDLLLDIARMKYSEEKKIEKLEESKKLLRSEIGSIEEKRLQYKSIIDSDMESTRKMIEEQLIKLKTEKPELLYFSGAEQIGKLAAYFFKWLFS